jgi:hypothetical protein
VEAQKLVRATMGADAGPPWIRESGTITSD